MVNKNILFLIIDTLTIKHVILLRDFDFSYEYHSCWLMINFRSSIHCAIKSFCPTIGIWASFFPMDKLSGHTPPKLKLRLIGLESFWDESKNGKALL